VLESRAQQKVVMATGGAEWGNLLSQVGPGYHPWKFFKNIAFKILPSDAMSAKTWPLL